MGSRPERGAYGNARGVPDKQRRRKRIREKSARHQAAAEEVRRNQELIDRLSEDLENMSRPTKAKRAPAVFVKPQPEEKMTTPVKTAPTPRFVPCHCSHAKAWHEGSSKPACQACGCPYYRPNTAPDPLADTAASVHRIEELIQHGRESENKRTVALANKIDTLLIDLKERVTNELISQRERQERLQQALEARKRVAELEAQLAEARDHLKEITPGAVRKSSKPRQAPLPKLTSSTPRKRGGVSARGEFKCPTCGDVKDTSQGLGAHRARKHGYRKGDDDK